MSNFDIIPLGRLLLVRLEAVEEKKVGKIHVPGEHSETSRVATVLAKGPKCEPGIEVGDKLLIDYHVGNVIDLYYKGEVTAINDTFRIIDSLAAQAIIKDKPESLNKEIHIA